MGVAWLSTPEVYIAAMVKPTDIEGGVVLDALFDGAYCVDRSLRITSWNAGAEQVTGFSREEVLGTRCSDNLLMHVDAEGRGLCRGGCPLGQTVRDGEIRESDIFLRHKQGHRVAVRLRTVPMRDATGEIVGALEIFTDRIEPARLSTRLAELERLAMVDTLTELPNRRYLDMSLESRLSELERYGRPFGVVMIDIGPAPWRARPDLTTSSAAGAGRSSSPSSCRSTARSSERWPSVSGPWCTSPFSARRRAPCRSPSLSVPPSPSGETMRSPSSGAPTPICLMPREAAAIGWCADSGLWPANLTSPLLRVPKSPHLRAVLPPSSST